jgi:hypothetical protein
MPTTRARVSVFAWALWLSLPACSAATPPQETRGSAGPHAGASAAANPANPSTNTGSTGTAGPAGPSTPGLLTTSSAPPTAGAAGTASAAASVPAGPIAIDQTGADNPAGLNPQDVQALIAGGPPSSLRILYPYDGTVFPRGLLPPLVMWDGGAADAVYVHLQAQSFDYKAVLKPTIDATSMAPQVALPDDVWAKAGLKTGGKSDPFTLELSTRVNGVVSGPVRQQFIIAQATVKGSIYYNSYASKLPGAALGGNVLRIPAGGKVELFMSMTCNGCHAVSADGSKMLSQIELTTGGNAYALTSGGPANPPGAAAGPRVSFGALYPDGSKYLSTSTAVSLAHAEIAEPPGTATAATLYDTATGQVVPGTDVPEGAVMPMFSPDGAHLVFNDFAINSADGLAVMDYDVASNKASNYKMLMKDDADTRPGWPFFLPDDKAVVFLRTASLDFSGNGAYVGAGGLAGILPGDLGNVASVPVPGPASDLHIADIATGTVTLLAKAMGFNAPADANGGMTSLPFPEDTHQNYFPTVAPIAAGGYFWVFFDSIRHYGNLGIQRQLWGTALDIQADGSYVADPSHPAFYVPGQEFGAGNHRAFAALDPCKKNGDSCTSGIDCCGGSCSFPTTPQEFGEPVGTCAPQMNTCAKRDERCKHDIDCCPPDPGQPANSCIAGFCAYIPLN